VTVSGASGSQVNFSAANTYAGATTINANATLEAQNADALGTTAAGTTVNTGGALKLFNASGLTFAAEALTINSDGIGNTGSLRNVGGANTWQGQITLGSDSRIGSSSGTLTISGGINLANNTLYLGGSSDITMSSAVSNAGKTTSNGAFWWDGTGTLRFNTAQSSLSGNISLRSGTVLLAVDSALGTGAVTVGANSALTLASADTTARSIGNNITMSGSDRLNLGQSSGGTGNLTLGGTLAFGATGANHFLNVQASTTKATINGIISGTGKNLIKEGSGTLSLSGNNSYSGGTYIDAGTLEFTAGTTPTTVIDIGTTAAATASAATLRLDGVDGYSLSPNITVNTGGSRTINFANASGNNTLGGTITANKTFDVLSANSGQLSGAISGAGGLNKSGSGTVILAGNNSYTGTTTISNGTLVLSNATSAIGNTNIVTLDNTAGAALTVALNETIGSLRGGGATGGSLNVTNGATLTVAETNSNTYAGAISGAGGFTKSGAGTVILTGANSSYSGNVSVSAGALRVGSATALGGTGGNTAVSSGAALELTSSPGSEALSLAGTGISSGGALRNISGNNSLSGLVTLTAATRINSDAGTLTLDVASGSAVTGTQNLTTGGAGNVTVADDVAISTGTLTKDGAGVLTLSGVNTYTGATTVTNGTLVVNGSIAGSAVSVGNATTDNGSVLMGSGSVGATTINNNGRISPGNSVGTLSVSNTLTFANGGDYLWEITNTTANTPGVGWDFITVDTTTTGDKLGTLALANSGQFTVTGTAIDGFSFNGGLDYTNNYFQIVGASTVTGDIGTLSFNNSGLGTGSWTFATNASGLFLNYVAPGITLLFTNTTAADQGAANLVTNNLAGDFATITNQGSTTAVIISNTAPVTFTNDANSYTGATIVASGSLVTTANSANNANGAFGNGVSTVQVGSTNGATSDAASLLIGSGGITVGRGVTINVGSTGTRTVGANNASGVATYSGNVTANTNVTLSSSNSGATTLFSGSIGGAGAVSIAGNGQVVLSGDNAGLTNTISIANGSTLVASNNNALGGGSGATTVNSGGVLALAGGINTGENITIAGTGISSGGALRNVNGANTNSGTITLSANATIAANAGTTLQLGNIDITALNRQLSFVNVGTVLLTGNFLNMGTNATFFKNGSGSLVISNTSANTGGGQLQVGAGSVTLAAGTFSTNTATDPRGLDLGFTAIGGASSSDTSFYVNNGVTMSNTVYVAGGTGARILGTESTTGTATFTGQIYLDNTLRVTAASGGTALFNSDIVNGGNLVKVGAGNVVLAGNNALGSITISNGTLSVTNGLAVPSTSLLTIDSGATFAVLGSENIGQFTGSGTVSIAASQGLTSTYSSASNSFAGTFTGAGSLSKNGDGTLTLAGNSTGYTGEVILNNGTLLAGNAGAFGTGTTTINYGDGTGTRTLASADATAYTLNNDFNLYYNAFTLGQATGGTGSLTLGGAGKTFNLGSDGTEAIRIVTVNGSHAITGEMTGGSNNRFAKAGTGSITLSGANTFSGGVQLREGTILVGNNAALGTGTFQVQFDEAGSKTIASSSSTGYTLGNSVNIYNDFTLGQTSGGTGSLTFSGGVQLGNEAGTRNITAATGTSHTFSGAISGLRGITKLGDGTLTLSGGSANTYSGATTVSAGVLELNKSTGNAIAGNLTVNSGATLLLSGSNQVASSGGQTVTLSGGTIQRGSGVSEVFGNLNLTTGSFLDFGTGTVGTMSFGTYTPSSLLTVDNFFQGNTLTFGSDLTSTINGGLFSFDNGFTSSWNSGTSTFTITAIPEPSTYLAAAGLLALFLWPVRRRLIKDAKSILGLRAPARDRLAH
jgi:autotransporter-associated beta strand protein